MEAIRVSRREYEELLALKAKMEGTQPVDSKRTGADVADDALQTAKKVGRGYLIACAVGLVFLLPWVLWVFGMVFRNISSVPR